MDYSNNRCGCMQRPYLQEPLHTNTGNSCGPVNQRMTGNSDRCADNRSTGSSCGCLDTHPDCPMAMQYFQNARRMNRQAMKSYEEVNGPLQVADADFNNWNWINGPWPWEGGIR